jgi:GMP synthase (glutamine-hydrolysing)
MVLILTQTHQQCETAKVDPAASHQTLLIVDFGGQYTQLIARRARELGVFTKIVSWSDAKLPKEWSNAHAIIMSGGPKSVSEPNSPKIPVSCFNDPKPVLGICYGMQYIVNELGGVVEPSTHREYGLQFLKHIDNSTLLKEDGQVWMSHGDSVVTLPKEFTVSGKTETCPIAAIENTKHNLFGVQFHPEVTHTEHGEVILRRFLYDVAKFCGDWTPSDFITDTCQEAKRIVNSGKVLCAVSGGVDSTVTAALLAKAIGNNLVCVFVNHGLMRKGEPEEVVQLFSKHIPAKLVHINASEQFLNALAGVQDPELKRKKIGEEFIRVFEDHANEIGKVEFLAQGTLYPDVIESGSEHAATIKTHHNVGGLPEWMNLKLIEPLKWLFKDEVRRVGKALALPDEMLYREPFPGPGLAVRIVGEVTKDRIRIVQEADFIFREELKRSGISNQIWQSYAALLDVKSVGVMGDERTYAHPVVLRAVSSEDAMTAKAVAIPFDILEHVARRIVNEVSGVNRVVYDLTSKPPGTIEWE